MPTEADGPQQFEAIVRVTDRFGLFDTRTMQINVLEVNRPPVLEPIDNRDIKPADVLTLTTSASDQDLPASRLTFSLQTGAIKPAPLLLSYFALCQF